MTLYKKAKPSGQYFEVTSDRFDVTLIKITISSVEPEDEGDYKLNATYITPRNETLSDEEEFTIAVHSKLSVRDMYGFCFGAHILFCVCNA